MPAKKKILIIHRGQFGYHSDTYYYCKYLTPVYDMSYICWDYGVKKIYLEGTRVIYLQRKGNLLIREINFLKGILKELRRGYDFQFIKYFMGSSLLKLISGKTNFLLDIRSGATKQNPIYRWICDLVMRIECRYFRHRSVISASLKQRLCLPENTFVLPIGAEIISNRNKTFNQMNLLYVGTLFNRNIHQSVKGFARFYHAYKDRVKMTYTIIGSGFKNEAHQIQLLADKLGISDRVSLTGQIPHNCLKPYFDSHNIGVAYVPKTPYYDVQPPTKTFEYQLSGMAVIATDTMENIKAVPQGSGVLTNDNAEAFFKGLVSMYNNKDRYDSDKIRYKSMPHHWRRITDDLRKKIEKRIKTS